MQDEKEKIKEDLNKLDKLHKYLSFALLKIKLKADKEIKKL